MFVIYFHRPVIWCSLNLGSLQFLAGGLYLAGVTTCSGAWATRGTSPDRGRWPFTAFRKRGERGEYSFCAIV